MAQEDSTRVGYDTKAVTVMGHECHLVIYPTKVRLEPCGRNARAFTGRSEDEVVEMFISWLIGPHTRRQRDAMAMETHSRITIPLTERIKAMLLPRRPVRVSNKYAYRSPSKGKIHVTVNICVNGKAGSVFGGYFPDTREGIARARQCSIETCRIINAEIERRLRER